VIGLALTFTAPPVVQSAGPLKLTALVSMATAATGGRRRCGRRRRLA